ncbi:hypothetical protein HMPREF0322_04135 [Desulfitobacterium hafniense DP7]|uniref:Uncharacterized protein n=4 Tax=root TaxID=1 RepID=G9XT29_DESHA|nr:hypothetical protein HMPREF0322_04135 [Desulfitobacterium hafniense DP7]
MGICLSKKQKKAPGLEEEKSMKVKIIQSLRQEGLEQKMNAFFQEHEGNIEIIEIQWKAFLEHYVMILYNEKK